MRSSASRNSGVRAGPKSSASKTCRISITPPRKGTRFAQSIASSFDLTLMIQKPGDQFVGIGERALYYGPLWPGERHPGTLRARVQPVGRKHYAGLDHLLVEFHHLGEQLLGGRTPASLSRSARTCSMNRIVISHVISIPRSRRADSGVRAVPSVVDRLIGQGPEIEADVRRARRSPGALGQQDADHVLCGVR